jgi:hypothetical protein
MALIFCDSYDNYTDPLQKWSSNLIRAFSYLSTVIVGTAFFPNGLYLPTRAFKFMDLAGGGYDYQIMIAIGDDLSVGVYRNSPGQDTLIGSSAPNVCLSMGWNYIEAKVTVAAGPTGSVVVRVNGVVVVNLSNVQTQGYNQGLFINGVQLLGVAYSGSFHDDTYICDTTPPNGDFLGAVRIYAEVPFADTATDQWTPSVAGPHFPLVNTIPPNIAEYVESNTPGQVDEYLHAITGIPPASEVLAVQHSLLASVNTAGTQVIASSLNEITGTVNTAPSVTPNMALQPYDVDPATGAAWVLAEIPTRRIGPVVTA